VVEVVGSHPTPAVVDLAEIPGVTVHADVSEVTPFYARAHAAVLPIRAGGGTRLKILEAFAHGVPVVSTAVGAEGLDVVARRHLLVAEEPEALAAASERVLTDPALARQLRSEALELLATRYDATRVGEGIRALFREIVRPRHARY
jgi:glycosyltransferase involved in cell wall biosynthesis